MAAPIQLFPPTPPPLPQGGADPLLVAPVLHDEIQRVGLQAAQLAGIAPAPVDQVGDGEEDVEGEGEDQQDQEEEVFDLRDRSSPPVPLPVAPGPDTEGWKAVDRIGAFDSFLVTGGLRTTQGCLGWSIYRGPDQVEKCCFSRGE